MATIQGDAMPTQNKLEDKNFSDWSHHVLEELVKLNSKYEALCDNYDTLSEKYDVLNKLLTGNGDPEKGLLIRVDRLEQEHKRKEVWIKAAIGASVTAIFGFLGMLFKMLMSNPSK